MSGEDWSVLYLRPDGWWPAGDGFASREEAERCAGEQLSNGRSWRVVPTDSDDARAARGLEEGESA